MYGAGYRPSADGRCRPISPNLVNVVFQVWAEVWPKLSPLSQESPPNHTQVLYYFEQFGAGMPPHHDMDYRANEFDRPQISGTDVMVVTMGDEMIFKLISPDFEKGQDHKFSQRDTLKNTKNPRLSHKIALPNLSVYIHTAHDDRILKHVAYFDRSGSDCRNRVRMALVSCWLGKTKEYRTNPNETPAKRHSVVEPKSFIDLDNMKHPSKW